MTGSPTAAQITPHAADAVRLPIPGGHVAALRRDAAPDAPTVLLVPGYTGSKEDFAPLLDRIAEAGYAVVAIDLPGQYESPGPDDEDAYSPTALGDVVAALVADLGPAPVLLLGHSYGGLVARAAVIAGADVAGLVLLGSGPAALPAGPRHDALLEGSQRLRDEGIEGALRVREALDAQRPERQDPALREFLRTRFLATTVACLAGMGEWLRIEPDRTDALRDALTASNIPAAVICGVDDESWPPALQRDTAELLGVPFTEIPDSAHSPNVENPAALIDALLAHWAAWVATPGSDHQLWAEDDS